MKRVLVLPHQASSEPSEQSELPSQKYLARRQLPSPHARLPCSQLPFSSRGLGGSSSGIDLSSLTPIGLLYIHYNIIAIIQVPAYPEWRRSCRRSPWSRRSDGSRRTVIPASTWTRTPRRLCAYIYIYKAWYIIGINDGEGGRGYRRNFS